MFEGEPEVADAEAGVALRRLSEVGGAAPRALAVQTWWDRRYEFYHPPHYPTLPAMWGTIDAVAPYATILDVYDAIRAALAAVRRRRPPAAHALQPLVRVGLDGLSALRDRRRVGRGRPARLYKEIWQAGVNAILDAGGVINDHHGIGSTLAPYVERQWGAAFATLRQIKAALDPQAIMSPGNLGL